MTTLYDMEHKLQTGRFLSPLSGAELSGELNLMGKNSYLRLHSPTELLAFRDGSRHISGTLNDLTSVTLVNCVRIGGGNTSRRGQHQYSADYFPHYVIGGHAHISPDDQEISSISFLLEDAPDLFYDFDAFGSVIDATPFITSIVRDTEQRFGRHIRIGESPQIMYFTGATEIFSVETVLGTISANHRPTFGSGGPTGVGVRNVIPVSIDFSERPNFFEAVNRMRIVVRFFELLAGRPQKLKFIGLGLHTEGDEHHSPLQVYDCFNRERNPFFDDEKPHVSDILVDAVANPENFSHVLSEWLRRNTTWGDARGRFFSSFNSRYTNNVDRLITCANLFDLLPANAIPASSNPSAELLSARDESRNLFRNLPPSLDRDIILGAIGRIGQPSLKQKIRHRAQFITEYLPDRYGEISAVTDEAVNCRNYFVHGQSPRFNYRDHPRLLAFFTETLEFVFAASDLIEAGWSITNWHASSTVMSHPFARYKIGYLENLQYLRSQLSRAD